MNFFVAKEKHFKTLLFSVSRFLQTSSSLHSGGSQGFAKLKVNLKKTKDNLLYENSSYSAIFCAISVYQEITKAFLFRRYMQGVSNGRQSWKTIALSMCMHRKHKVHSSGMVRYFNRTFLNKTLVEESSSIL